ncbi:hypothetical protein AN217_25510 [Streptomyces qinglanensis]|uniref:Uncharacterized protein n=1 Tax=Streptomyces qinglanensis TaxID=943816 RepID=A0A1E7K9K0_9ACTN|nr:hypothetical protein AN217_25510 [Streptomyces qinglanensis]OEV09195.1 hypothetical protein AN220_32060 [Streptomyces nanshensis]
MEGRLRGLIHRHLRHTAAGPAFRGARSRVRAPLTCRVIASGDVLRAMGEWGAAADPPERAR